jgi:hypothetical protein
LWLKGIDPVHQRTDSFQLPFVFVAENPFVYILKKAHAEVPPWSKTNRWSLAPDGIDQQQKIRAADDLNVLFKKWIVKLANG